MNHLQNKLIELYKKRMLHQAGTATIMDPILFEYNNLSEEMAAITLKIEAITNKEIEPEKVVIVCPQNKYIHQLSQYLQIKKMPVFCQQLMPLSDHHFSKKIIKLLQYVKRENDFPHGGDDLLFAILHFDFFRIDPKEIIELTIETNSKKNSANPDSMRTVLHKKASSPPKDLFDAGCNQSLKNAFYFLHNLLQETTLSGVMENIFSNALLLNYVTNNTEALLLQQIIIDFKKIEKNITEADSLTNIINDSNLIEKLITNFCQLTIQTAVGNNKGIHLITAEQLISVDFGYIFFIVMNDYFTNSTSINLKKYSRLNLLLAAKNKQAAILKLLDLALSGKTNKVEISYTQNNPDGKPNEEAILISGIAKSNHFQIQKVILSAHQSASFNALSFVEIKPQIAPPNEIIISSFLKKFAISVSSLNNFLRCPLQFYYQNIIKVPASKNEYFEFGSAIHFALENLFRKMQDKQPNSFDPPQQMLEDFNFYMNKNRVHFTKENFAPRLNYGETLLINYYAENLKSWNKIVAIERNIQGVFIKGVPIKGKIDKMEFNGKEIDVVDYKSGHVEKALLQLKPPHNENPNGGNYWRQAVFYKILIDNYQQKNWKVISTEFDFIERDENGLYRKEKVFIETRDIETVQQQITAMWAKIQSRDLFTGCGKPSCHWCNFVKDNNLDIGLHSVTNSIQL